MKNRIILVYILLLPVFAFAGLRTENVTFQSGKYHLEGKITTAAPAGQKVPAIVFCVGSKESSFAGSYKGFLAAFLEDNFALDSIALFYFEKRGLGNSEGNWARSDFYERVEDAKAAAEFLKSKSFIDPARILVSGHSQGGWIAQLCVAKYPELFAGGISMAGPTFGVRKQVYNDYYTQFICKGETTRQAAKLADKKTKRLLRLANIFPVNAALKQLKVIGNYEPESYIRKIKKPFLFMFGENDRLVDVTWSREGLHDIFTDKIPQNIAVAVIPGANHSFKLTSLCGPAVKASYSEEGKFVFRHWVSAVISK